MLYLNGQPLNITVFPDNTSQVWKLPEPLKGTHTNPAKILWNYSSESEVMQLFQLLHLFDTMSVTSSLEITYLPYARQDKFVANDACFALKTFWKLFNNFSFVKELIIHDPHNEYEIRPSCSVKFIYPVKQVEQIAQSMDSNGAMTIFCYPDKGALKKYSKVYEQSYRSHIYGEKVRDQLTGNILNYKVVGDPAGKNVLIVDDICDGGMTFKLLAKDLLAAGALTVNLFVTHGIFSKGLRTLKNAGINKIFTQEGEAREDRELRISYRRL